MVDDKKIEKACDKALKNSGFNDNAHVYPYVKGFYNCAKWAINELLKDLWHPIEEEPNKGKFILIEMRNGDNYALYFVNDKYSWERICAIFTTTSWLYIDDLLLKKGGEQ